MKQQVSSAVFHTAVPPAQALSGRKATKQIYLVLQLSPHLTQLCLKALDGEILIPQFLRLSLEVCQLLQNSLVGGFKLSYPCCGILNQCILVLLG